MFENLDAAGRTFQSKLGRDGCSKLQSFYGEALKPLGFRRGIKKKLSGAEHQDVMESHFIAREKAKEEVKQLEDDQDILQEKIGASTSILEGLSDKKGALIRELEALEVERKNLRRSRDEMHRQTAVEKAETTALQQELRKRRDELKGQLADIIKSIEAAEKDKSLKEALAMEVLKENAQEDEAFLQEK